MFCSTVTRPIPTTAEPSVQTGQYPGIPIANGNRWKSCCGNTAQEHPQLASQFNFNIKVSTKLKFELLGEKVYGIKRH